MALHVKNWKEFQHYRGRRPPWIKLHRPLLDDFEFSALPVASQAIAIRVWLFASESADGSIPSDLKKLSYRFRMTEREVVAAVKPLIDNGFLDGYLDASDSLAGRKQVTRPEESREERENNGNDRRETATLASTPLASATDQEKAIERFNVAFRRSFDRPKAALPPDKAPVFVARAVSGYAVEFLIGLPVAVRASGLDKGREVQPEFLLRNGSGQYTRGGETRKTFDWIGSLWQAADRLVLDEKQAQILKTVEVFDWWVAKGAIVTSPETAEC